jgi:hypothetical protein
MATPMPETPAQMPIARARSFGSWNRFVSSESVAGMTSEAPMPMTDRVRMRCRALVANTEAIEPATKITSPALSALRRPNRSPRLPDVNSNPANTSVYPSTIHCSWLVVADRSSAMLRKATFRMVLSNPMISRLRHSTPSPIHRRSCTAASSIPAR